MAKTPLCFAACAMAICSSGSAFANLISVDAVPTWRSATAAERNAAFQPVPLGYRVWQFYVTTDSDILALENVRIDGAAGTTYYNNTFGDLADANPPAPGLEVAFPSVTADTYFDTPGNTSRLGAPLPGDGITTFGDLDSNGPQSNFKFAQITIPDAAAINSILHVRMSINSTTNPGTPFS